jgi:hypothetical protein
MFEITLKELNRINPTLQELCDQKLPKDNGELITRLSRIRRTARKALEIWEEDQKTIAITYGFRIMGPGQAVPLEDDEPVTNKAVMDFQEECLKVMKDQKVRFRSNRFTESEWKQFKPLFNLSPRMEDDLEWLLPEEKEEPEEKAASAGGAA